MIIKQNLVPASKYQLKCPYVMSAIGVCVHNTANDASAAGEIAYMIGNENKTSFHFAVDDVEAVQGLPLDRNGWHAGDGNGDGNRKHIGIEICYSKSGGARFDNAEENAAILIAKLLKERKWGVERVKKHQDFSGKHCPALTLDMGWERFLNKIRKYMKSEGGNMSEVPQELQRFGKGTNKDLAAYIDELNSFVEGGRKDLLAVRLRLGLTEKATQEEVLKKITDLSAPTPTPTVPSNPTGSLPTLEGFELETVTFRKAK